MWLGDIVARHRVNKDTPLRSFRAWRMKEHVLCSVYVPWESEWSDFNVACQHGGTQHWDIVWSFSGGGRGSHAELAPSLTRDNTTGIYGHKRRRDLVARLIEHQDEAPLDVLALGHCDHWGWVVEHVDGYRSQYARPSRVFVQPQHRELAPLVAEAYSCEVSVRRFPS